ncbi:tandem-95 repeat protein [Pseudoalteromonas fenneropenaei]|uniref:Tandem-95 repeat protein n=1 Tax=Pseudoalteromonas fenneropenaei TaxID=1737459 RepID=A0ABV7CBZ5_9GAMM
MFRLFLRATWGLVGLSSMAAFNVAANNLWWTPVVAKPAGGIAEQNIAAQHYYLNRTSAAQLSDLLLQSGQTTFDLELPMPDGSLAPFRLTHSPVYAPELAAKFPVFRTFSGYQLNNPENNGRFDITPQGFHGSFIYQGKRAYIDPYSRLDANTHISYFREDAINTQLLRQEQAVARIGAADFGDTQFRQARAGETLKTYRIAVAAAGEYTAFHGGTKELAQAAIVTAINRINEVYQRDLSVQLQLVANNDAVIFTDAATDPYANTDDDLDTNQSVMENNIGTANYDIGHVFNTGGGGVAYLGVVCDNNYKWGGMTGSSSPTADPFVIDYVAHEIGHQFAGQHSFNGTAGACSTRSANDAYEPGSGSTIMAYAGICGNENLQANSDAFFHAHSLEQMRNFIANTAICGTTTALNNTAPVVNAGSDYTIPANTAFKLTGSATDAENDVLSYSWEQFDLGTASNSKATMVDDGSRPIFRAWQPSNEAVRYLPRLASVLSGSLVTGEAYPTTTRSLTFRLVGRDGKGNIASDTMQVNVIASAGPFAVTAPESGALWDENSTPSVTWNPAGSNNSPINCSNVDILLSNDGGNTFNTVLKAATPNDGNESVAVPGLQTNQARVQVRCSDNIFFAVNNGNFTVQGKPNLLPPQIVGQTSLSTPEDIAVQIKLSDLQVSDADSDYPGVFTLSLGSGSNYSVSGDKIIPAANFNGTLSVPVKVNDGKFDSNTFNLTITVTAVNDAPVITAASSVVVDEDTRFTVAQSGLTITDVDSPASALSVRILSGTNYTVENNQVVPTANFFGVLTVRIVVSDGNSDSTPFNLPVTVRAVNDAPVITAQKSLTVAEDNALTLSLSDLQVTDVDNAASDLSLVILPAQNYTASGLSVTPASNFNGSLNVSVAVSDGSAQSSAVNLVVNVTAVNDAPLANNDSAQVTKGSGAVNINVLANDTDVDGDALTISAINYSGQGTATITSSGISYAPAANFVGSESLTYTVSDPSGATAMAQLTITVAEPSNNSSSSGGSIGWMSLLLLAMMGVYRQVRRLAC